jgi:uncharacterized protein
MRVAIARLRQSAFRHTLSLAPSLAVALRRLPFVQADPIRAPARAQDLILRQRVAGYRVGDLERAYGDLDLEEGFLYAYGFLPRSLWQLRHPPDRVRLSALEKKVLGRVEALGVVHPEALRAELGRRSAVNAWGGQSSRVTLALESLHRRGLVRVARRDKGIRVYAPCPPPTQSLGPSEVFERLALAVVQVLAPVQERTLRSIMARLSRRIVGVASPARELGRLVERGLLERQSLDDIAYVAPSAAEAATAGAGGMDAPPDPAPRVRFLAPFDPLVWDRQRFEHLWGWSYRFEAYTPARLRVRGYYAMPLSRGTDIIGWANVSARGEALDVDVGFVRSRPRERAFARELDAEVERLRATLLPAAGADEVAPAPEPLAADDAPTPGTALERPRRRGRSAQRSPQVF